MKTKEAVLAELNATLVPDSAYLWADKALAILAEFERKKFNEGYDKGFLDGSHSGQRVTINYLNEELSKLKAE